MSVLLLGPGELQDLSLVLFVGMLSGTYSSICIATPVLADLKERSRSSAAAQAGRPARGSVKRQAKVAVGNGPATTTAADGAEVAADKAAPDPEASAPAAPGAPGAGQAVGRDRRARGVRSPAAAPAAACLPAAPVRQEEAQVAAVVRGRPVAPGPAGGEDIAALLRRLIRDVPDYPQPGVIFKDITPLLADPAGLSAAVHALATGHDRIDKVAGIEARGFILAAPVACELGVGFVPVRKVGKLPGPTHAETYDWSTAPPPSRCTRTRSPGGAGADRR